MVYELDAGLKPIPNEFFVAAHGNPIHAIVKHLEDTTDDVTLGSWQFHPCHLEVLGGCCQ